MATINKLQVSLDRDRYLQRMWAKGLRPVIYLLDGRVWPTLEACSQDIGYSTTFITHECLLDDGYFAFFPEYFWGRWKIGGLQSQFTTELASIDAGVSFDVNPGIVRKPIKFRRLEKDLESLEPGEIPKEPRYYEKRGKLGVMVLDKTTWTLYPSISACARALKTSRSAIYAALARDGVIKGHRLTL